MERLVGLTKTTLKKVLGRSHVSYEELQTVIIEIQATLNDRPLTFTRKNPTNPDPLTPALLLHGRWVTTLPYHASPPDVDVVANGIKRDYSTLIKRAHQQKMIDHIRDRWKLEYLTALREYHSTTVQNTQTIKQGDVVQIHDERPRTTWKLAIIKQLIIGKLKTKHVKIKRPIARLLLYTFHGLE